MVLLAYIVESKRQIMICPRGYTFDPNRRFAFILRYIIACALIVKQERVFNRGSKRITRKRYPVRKPSYGLAFPQKGRYKEKDNEIANKIGVYKYRKDQAGILRRKVLKESLYALLSFLQVYTQFFDLYKVVLNKQ